MIFVITGTEKFPFDRMVQAVDRWVAEHTIQKPVFIQLGTCEYIPQHCTWERYLSFGEMCDKIRAAETVIAHAGAGTTLLCIQMGHIPILVPRRKMHREHVDDHQSSFARKFLTTGLVNVLENINDLDTQLKKQAKIRADGEIASVQKENLISALNHYLQSI